MYTHTHKKEYYRCISLNIAPIHSNNTRTYLGLNANFDDTSSNGEGVADDEEDIPAVDEL